MKNPIRTWFLPAVAAAAVALSGCVAVVAAGAGAGTVAWVQGRLDAPLNAGYRKSVAAVDRAIAQLEFARISNKQDALTSIFVARTAADKKVEITVIKVSDDASKVQIRIGIFGDEALSMTILDRIKANL